MPRPRRIDNPAPTQPPTATGENRAAHVITVDPAAPDDTLSALNAPELTVVDALDLHDADQPPPEPASTPTPPPVVKDGPAAPSAEGQDGGDGTDDDPRFKGKPASEVIRAFKNLEAKIGEQGQELGRYRTLFDQAVLNRTFTSPPQPQPQPQPDTAEDDSAILNEMLTKPKQFVEKIRQGVRQEIGAVSQQSMVNQIKAQATDILADPTFATWLRGNVPHSVAVQADSDPNTLMFVLNSYRAVRGQSATPAPTPQPAPIDRTATSERIVAAARAPTPVKQAGDGKRVYRRSEIMALMVDNPKKYAEMEAEFMRAYEEGRVK